MKEDKVSFNFNIDSEKHFNKEVLCNAFSYLPITNQGTKYVKESFVFLKSLDLAGSVAMEEKDILQVILNLPQLVKVFLKIVNKELS